MEHTKKFVLVDPRFVRPSMRDKALSGLDSDISNILNDDVSDEIKVNRYISALSRFKNIFVPPPSPPGAPPPQPQAAVAPPQVPMPQAQPQAASVTYKVMKPPKRPHKRAKVVTDASLWERALQTPAKKSLEWIDDVPVKRTKRLQTKKKFDSQWLVESKKKKSWVQK